jgi:tetratricopeptide (TPR) repeat protein
MTILSRLLVSCALLLAATLAAHADELQDIGRLYKQKNNEQALARVDTYLAGNPKDAEARFLKGLILTAQDKQNDAIRVFSDLIEDYPELPEPYNNLAVLYAGQGQYEKAKTALEMAIRAHPGYATALENLGDIYAIMAGQSYERALQLDRGNSNLAAKLAKARDIAARAASAKPPEPNAVTMPETAPSAVK